MYSYRKLKMLRFSDVLGHAFLNYCTYPKIDDWIQFTFQKGLSVNLRECISFWTVNDGIPYWLQHRSVFHLLNTTIEVSFDFIAQPNVVLHSETKSLGPTSYVFSHVMKTLHVGAPAPLHCCCDTKRQVMSIMEDDSRDAQMHTGRNKAPARHKMSCHERNVWKN
jgi:hypothetical protein